MKMIQTINTMAILLILIFSVSLTALAASQVPEGANVEALYAQQEKQPFTRADGSIEFLDTIWIYYSDNSFVQYAFSDDQPVVFSEGTYRFENGGSFLRAEDSEDSGNLVITRTSKYVDGEGLQDYSSEHSYSLDNIGFRQIYCLGKKGKSIAALFAGCGKQSFGEEQMLDTYWIFYDDMTFEQYACLGSDPVLFSEGTYSLSEGADFRYEEETDFGDITITRTKKFQEGLNYADYTSEHTYDLNSLGFSLLVIDEDTGSSMQELSIPENIGTEEGSETEGNAGQFSLIFYDAEDPEYSYILCDFYLGDTKFGSSLGCPDAGDTFTHFDYTPDMFEGIEGDFELADFRAEISLGYNEYSGEEALMQAMMGNTGQMELLLTLEFAPKYGERYEYKILPADDGYVLEEMK